MLGKPLCLAATVDLVNFCGLIAKKLRKRPSLAMLNLCMGCIYKLQPYI
jgi:hypothetical protein